MKSNFSSIKILDDICQKKYQKIQRVGVSFGYTVPNHRIFPIVKPKILDNKNASLIIAEVKRASPTQGRISDITNPLGLVEMYLKQGADAISVLCEEDYFKGSLLDLLNIKRTFPSACILRKDFIIMKEEIAISYLFGADMVLLIMAIFDNQLQKFQDIYNEVLSYNLTPFIEIHNIEEWNLISQIDSLDKAIIGINCRDLKTFEINKMNAIKLRAKIPSYIPIIFESGIKTCYDSFIAGNSGFQGILCGSFLVHSFDSIESNLHRDSTLKQKQKSEKVRNQRSIVSLSNKHSSDTVSQNYDKDSQALMYIKDAFIQGTSSKHIYYLLAKKLYDNNITLKPAQINKIKPLVKVCGINNIYFLQAAMCQADMLGFILTDKSPRYVKEDFLVQARTIIRESKGDAMPLCVGVVTQECLPIGLKLLKNDLLDCLQLHDMPICFYGQNLERCLGQSEDLWYGDFNLSHCNAKELGFHQNMFPFYSSCDISQISCEEQKDYKELLTHFILWDKSGGSGEKIDIAMLKSFLQKNPAFYQNLWLAGGIDVDNLYEILSLQPMIIDVCSGFEIQKGEKSIEKMQRFFKIFENYYVN